MKEFTSDCQPVIVRIDGEASSEEGVGLDPGIVAFKRSLDMDIEASQVANRKNGKTNNTTSSSDKKNSSLPLKRSLEVIRCLTLTERILSTLLSMLDQVSSLLLPRKISRDMSILSGKVHPFIS